MAIREQPHKNYLVLDTENTISNSGAPYDKRNKNVGIAYCTSEHAGFTADYAFIQKLVDEATDLIGHNFKYDLAWLHNCGIQISNKRIWDTQVGEYLLSHQQFRYPSLEECATKYKLGHKFDYISKNYWENGINTDQIPWEELAEYATQDALLTWGLYQAIDERIGDKRTLWMLDGLDLIVLETLERNGILIDKAYQAKKRAELEEKLREVEERIRVHIPRDIPNFNINSGEHLSCLLYGGTIISPIKIPDGTYKGGIKKGLPKFRNGEQPHILPGLTRPIKGTELKKEGYYKTDEGTLLKLNDKAGLVPLLLKQSQLTKLIGTYFKYEELMEEMGWDDYIHSSFSQVTTNTGRLSSARPNIQNTPPEVDPSFITRYDRSSGQEST